MPSPAESPTHARPLSPVTPEIVDAQVVLEELDLSPDGRTVIVVRRRTRGLEYVRDLLFVDLDGGPPRALHVPLKDPTHPRWSPDGQWIAALATGTGHVPQIHLSRVGSGVSLAVAARRGSRSSRSRRSRQLTHEAHGVSGFAWSPDAQAPPDSSRVRRHEASGRPFGASGRRRSAGTMSASSITGRSCRSSGSSEAPEPSA
jgi:dipeptidyl aminopeptidase/acylaminoacyl peptidase